MTPSAAPSSGFRGPRSGLVKLLDIAKGGMGTVELSLRREGGFRRLCAVKRLHPHLLQDEDLRAMFVDEARIAGLLRHANVVSVLDVGEDESGPFLVMDYVDGVTLSAILHRHASHEQLLPVQLCARIGADIARGLQVAHELTAHDGQVLDIVHRDVSPQNVLVGFDGQVRLADFGIARALGRSSKLTADGVIKGKLGYQAPEQLRFEEASARSDLFALGVVLYELLSGKRLYKSLSRSPTEVPVPLRILQEPPPDIGDERADVPPELTELLFELLAKRREDRPESARVVAARLDDCVVGLLRDEEPMLLAGYMDRVFGDQRRAQAETVAQAVARAEARELVETTPAPAPPREAQTVVEPASTGVVASFPARRRALRIAAGAVVVAVGAAVALTAGAARLRSRAELEEAIVKAPAASASLNASAPVAASSAPPAEPAAPFASATAPRGAAASSAPEARHPAPRGSSASGPHPSARGIPTWNWK